MNQKRFNAFYYNKNNAAIHISKLTKDWFKTKNIEVLDWPTNYPDLNPIENFCQEQYTKINVNLKVAKFKNLALNSIGMEFHLKLSEISLIQFKTGVLKY